MPKTKRLAKNLVAFIIIFQSVTPSFGQQYNFDVNNTWADNPTLHNINNKDFDSAAAIGILDEKKVEIKYEDKNPVTYSTYHKIIKIKEDKGIDMYNKVYIPIYENAEITDVKGRTIMPGGNVVNFDISKIKEVEEDGQKYKIFALDGVEKGTEIEYTYTSKRPFFAFGSEIFQSTYIPYVRETFTLITPTNLRFSAKGFNGFNVSNDSVIGDTRLIVGYADNVPQMNDEKYSFNDKYLKRVEFKLSYNLSNNTVARLYTWKEYAKKAFSFYTNWTDKDIKAVNELINQISLPAGAEEVEKIKSIEDYLKTNFNIDKKLVAENGTLTEVIKTKSANEEGIIRLFTAIFDKLNISYQIVFAEDRFGIALDEEVENWNRATDVLMYFPSSGKFIAPANITTRYPYIPANLAATRGLFLKGTQIGSFKTAVGTFDTIPMEPYENNLENMEATVKFNESLDTLIINSKQILNGYEATDMRPVYVFAPKDKQDEVTKDIIKNVGNSLNISNTRVDNTKLTDCASNKPLIISGDIKSADMLENAGNKILFKIGEIIGNQVEMYQEKARQLPIELAYPQIEDRKIIVYLPDNYKVKNPNDLNINVQFKDGEEVTMGFVSTYTLNGNTLEINLHETYRRIYYPISEYNNFEKVINASADFNKVVLVLEKKS